MQKLIKSLLSIGYVDRDALTHILHKIKPRFTQCQNGGLRRFINIVRLSVFGVVFVGLFGLTPVLSLPYTQVLAEETIRQYTLPHVGYISTYYSPLHPGVDIATDLGTKIYPIKEGVVDSVNFGNEGLGNYVVVIHQDGIKSLYAHTASILVKKGQAVTIGTELAAVGITGHTSGPHTHLEITKDGIHIDPVSVLPQLSALAVLVQDASSKTLIVQKLETKIEQKPTELRKTLQVDAN